jgi:NTP pyrophosphatase (non-canonical NTP hydrolase)
MTTDYSSSRLQGLASTLLDVSSFFKGAYRDTQEVRKRISDKIDAIVVDIQDSFPNMKSTMLVLHHVHQERDRQESLKRDGKFLWTCDHPDVSLERKLGIVTEELGEVAREINEYGFSRDKYAAAKMEFPPHRKVYYLKRLREELVQTAASCVAWCEGIDRILLLEWPEEETVSGVPGVEGPNA